MGTQGDARSFKGKQLSGSSASGQVWVDQGDHCAPVDFSSAIPAGWSDVSGWASGGSGLASGTSGALTATSGALQSGITNASGVAQSGLDLASSGIADIDVVGGRLELVNSGQIKYAFYQSNQIRLWNPATSGWEIVRCAAEPTLDYNFTDLSGWNASGERAYDVFAQYASGSGFTLVVNPWSGANTRYVEPAQFEGVYCYDNTTDDGKSRRWLGTIYMETGPIFREDSGCHFIDNFYHPKDKIVAVTATGGAWVCNNDSYSELAGGSGVVRAEVVLCQAKSVRGVGSIHMWVNATGPIRAAIGVDSTSANSGVSVQNPFTGQLVVNPQTNQLPLSEGYHYYTILMGRDAGSGTIWRDSSRVYVSLRG